MPANTCYSRRYLRLYKVVLPRTEFDHPVWHEICHCKGRWPTELTH